MTLYKMKSIKEIYENNISEDIVYDKDTIFMEETKVMRKLSNKRHPFFLVVLGENEKILGVITRDEITKILNEFKKSRNTNVPFGDYAKKHIALSENTSIVKCLKELKNENNLGFILVKNKEGNYVGKVSMSTIKEKL